MKKYIIFIFALTVSIVNAQVEQAPSLPLEKAAQIAQKKLDDLYLSSDNFLRSISYQHDSQESSPYYYIATFEPLTKKIVSKQGSATPDHITIKVIKVTMDGKASVIEVKIPIQRFIQNQN